MELDPLSELLLERYPPHRRGTDSLCCDEVDMDSTSRPTKLGRSESLVEASESIESFSLYLVDNIGTLLFLLSSLQDLSDVSCFCFSFMRIFLGKSGDLFPLLVVNLLKAGAFGSGFELPSIVCICKSEARSFAFSAIENTGAVADTGAESRDGITKVLPLLGSGTKEEDVGGRNDVIGT